MRILGKGLGAVLLLALTLPIITPHSTGLGLQLHLPITIIGDGNFTFVNGVVGGSGTVTDPYIIEGWDINAAFSTGIEISHTHASFIIRNVNVHSGGQVCCFGGVKLVDVANGRVENSTISDNTLGIYTIGGLGFSSSNVAVFNNDLLHNGNGLSLYGASNVTVSHNRILRNGVGINFGLTNATISGNEISNNNGKGITGYGSHVAVSDNDISYSRLSGIVISGYDVRISANRVFSNAGGIGLSGVHEGEISENTVSNNWDGGIGVAESREVVVRHNNIVDNGFLQATNGLGDGEGEPSSWDDGYPGGGNFWSDYVGVDNCSGPGQDVCSDPDGLGDTPYLVEEFSRDQYPLVMPFETIRGQLDVQPHVISLSSKARYVTAFIELPDGYKGSNIDAGSIRLNGTIAPDSYAPIIITDHNGDNIPDLMVKFRLQDVRLLFPRPGIYALAVTGNTIVGGRPFVSFDRILVTTPSFNRSFRMFS